MPCRKDNTLPECEICRPSSREICPLFNGGESARSRSLTNLGYSCLYRAAFATDLEEPTEEEMQSLIGTGAILPTARKYVPEPLQGKGKVGKGRN